MRVLLFDLYGVFLHSQGGDDYLRLVRELGVDGEAMRPHYVGNRRDFDANDLDAPAYWARIADAIGVEIDWRQAVAADLASFPGKDEAMVAYVAQLRGRGVPMGLLSNLPTVYGIWVREHHPWIHECFDPVLFSCELGMTKPDPAIFESALEALRARIGEDIDAADVLFVDDTPANVEAATALGFCAHHFRGVEALREAVDEHLAG